MNFILRQLNVIGWKRKLALLLLVWIIILLFTIIPMLTNHMSTSTDTLTSDRLNRALADLEVLRKQNVELQEVLKGISVANLKPDQKEALENFQHRLIKADRSLNDEDEGYIHQKEDPSMQYEILRRRLSNSVQEFWYYIHSELKKLQNLVQESQLQTAVKSIVNLGTQQKQSLLNDLEKLAEVDGYATWREKEANDLSNLVQARFRYLQNPTDCKKAKKLVCDLNKLCGYGCQLHHVVYCFMVAYGTQRTLILESKGWRYHKAGWEEIFQPISESCTSTDGETVTNWPGFDNVQVLTLPIVDSISPRPPFLPLAIPEDLAPRLLRLHGDPFVWWVGQILKYLLRPQEKTSLLMQNAITNLNFQRPIVGVHVRRTDKVGYEAEFHGIEEYMNVVDEYYNQLELKKKVDKRRIYLATDDPKVIADAKAKYSHYEILGDPKISKTAALASRYSDTSLQGIILDIHMLSMTDYLVCTFSSQVCRMAYEIMQNYYPDASSKFRSLDDVYYYGGQTANTRVAVFPHEPQVGEIQLKTGDVIAIASNYWNGFSKGKESLGLLAISHHLLALDVWITDAGSTLGTVVGVEVSKCKNADARCILHRNTNCSIAIKFSPKQEIKKIKSVVHGIVMSMPVEFPLPNSDGCTNSGLTCPLKQGETYTYNAQLPVLQRYPKITVDVKWELQLDTEALANKTDEDTSQDIICVIIPARIQ